MDSSDREPPQQRSWLRRLINRLEVDQAVFFSIVARGWQFVSGPVTVTLLAIHLSDAERGYFTAFAGILAMQLFFELSLHVVLINLSSHEWAKLELDENGEITGDENALTRLISLGRISFLCYIAASILFTLAVAGAGILILSEQSVPKDEWLAPWLLLVVSTAGLLLALPFTAILEGCGQLPVVNRFRVVQAVTGSVVVWTVIVSGGGLWAAVGAAAVRLFWEVFLIVRRYRRFFRPFLKPSNGQSIEWWKSVWPLQWRLAIQGVFGYFSMHLFTLVIFHCHGDAAGGRMGLTWNILVAIQAGTFAWVETRRSLFGELIATRRFDRLDQVFFRLTAISMAFLIAAVALFCGLIATLNALDVDPAVKLSRALLPLFPTIVLSLALVVIHVPRCMDIYVRAHNRDPFLIPNLATSSFIGAAVWFCGKHYGVEGLAVGYLAVIALIYLPCWSVIWFRCRRDWHSENNKQDR